jgi:hypothetical protein
MAVAHDAHNESHTGTTGSASEASFAWDHVGGGSARAALVAVFSIQATPDDTGVTYGAVAMALVAGSEANDTATEPGTVRFYFLDAVLTGTRQVVVSRVNDATVMYAISATVTAAGAVEPFGVVLLEENQSPAQVNVDDGSPGTNSVRYAGGYYGAAGPPTAGSASTLLHNIDLTSFGCAMVRETTAGQGSRLIGFTNATSDDFAASHLALREVVARVPRSTPYPQLLAH